MQYGFIQFCYCCVFMSLFATGERQLQANHTIHTRPCIYKRTLSLIQATTLLQAFQRDAFSMTSSFASNSVLLLLLPFHHFNLQHGRASTTPQRTQQLHTRIFANSNKHAPANRCKQHDEQLCHCARLVAAVFALAVGSLVKCTGTAWSYAAHDTSSAA